MPSFRVVRNRYFGKYMWFEELDCFHCFFFQLSILQGCRAGGSGGWLETPPSVFLSIRYLKSSLFIDSLLCLLKYDVNIRHMRCYRPVTSSNMADFLLFPLYV